MVLLNVFINVNLKYVKWMNFEFWVFSAQDRVVSTASKQIFDRVTPSGTVYLDCDSSDASYVITCSRCFLQFVGETNQKINEKFNWQEACFKNFKKYSFCWISSDHFRKGVYKNVPYRLQILEERYGNGRTTRGALDGSIAIKRKRMNVKARNSFPLRKIGLVMTLYKKTPMDLNFRHDLENPLEFLKAMFIKWEFPFL